MVASTSMLSLPRIPIHTITTSPVPHCTAVRRRSCGYMNALSGTVQYPRSTSVQNSFDPRRFERPGCVGRTYREGRFKACRRYADATLDFDVNVCVCIYGTTKVDKLRRPLVPSTRRFGVQCVLWGVRYQPQTHGLCLRCQSLI